MRTISASLRAHLQSGSTTLVHCVKITRRDGLVFGFTNHDRDLTVASQVYETALGGELSAMETSDKMNVDTLDMRGFLDALGVNEAEISAGSWDHADVRVFLVNWADVSMGTMKLRRGWMGEVSVTREFKVELRGVAQRLQHTIIELTGELCQANLFDDRCTLTPVEGVTQFTSCVVAAVSSTQSQREFQSDGTNGSPPSSISGMATDAFTNGKVLWLTGNNAGLYMEIKTHSRLGSPSTAVFLLGESMPFPIVAGDTFTAWVGCLKRHQEDCIEKFNNEVNFRAFPYLPGFDHMAQVP